MTIVLGVTPLITLHEKRHFEDVIKDMDLLALNEGDSSVGLTNHMSP